MVGMQWRRGFSTLALFIQPVYTSMGSTDSVYIDQVPDIYKVAVNNSD